MKKINKNFIIGGCLFFVFIVFTILVKFVDVQAIGPIGSKVGLAGLNELYLVKTSSTLWDNISDIIMAISLLVACLFVVIGIAQWVHRKKFKEIDRNIFIMAGLYIAIIVVYVFFEVVVVNNRPILEKGELVASFPSSHVLISVSILFSALIQAHKYYISSNKLMFFVDIAISILTVTLVISRILSGVHWITDIIGSLLISGALVFIHNGLLDVLMKKNRE
jgi:undecaprenyl-diphosphatase